MAAAPRRAGAAFVQRLTGGMAGAVLGAGFATTALLRRDKPLHPRGIVSAGALTLTPAEARAGVPLLDASGVHPALVRVSYAVGTGPEGADIEGLALRLPSGGPGGRPVDVLFASTGSGRLSRFVLAVRRPGVHATLTTLLPVQAQAGPPLLLRLAPRPGAAARTAPQSWPTAYVLSWAHGRGPWRVCGELTVSWQDEAADAPHRFDPVANVLPGARQYPLVAWLREPAYALSRLAWPRAGRLPRR